MSKSQSRSSSAVAARQNDFDVLRGMFLVIMAVNHVPWAGWFLTQQPLGFVTAAEGFVLLAGVLVGVVYTRKFHTGGKAATTRLLVRRAGKIYLAHVACIAAVFAWVWLYASFSDAGSPPVGSPWIYHERPVAAALASLALILQPGLLDVLPMYFGFVLVTPMVLRQLMRGRLIGVLIGSGLCWAFTNVAIPPHPIVHGLIDTSSFNFGAWQLLYVLGLAAGHAWSEKRLARWLTPSGTLLAVLAALALGLALARHGVLDLGLSPATLEMWVNKNDLSPLRLLNVAVLALLVRAWLASRARRGTLGIGCAPLALLGRHSMAVFAVHVVAAIVILGLPSWFAWTAWGPWFGPALLLGAMFATAAIAEQLAARRQAAHFASPHDAHPTTIHLSDRVPEARRNLSPGPATKQPAP